MVFAERRHAENARLREKIDRIQQAAQKLQNLAHQIQVQTVATARQGHLHDLPCEKFARDLSATFQQQRATVSLIQEQITGTPVRNASTASLITAEELTALMK